MKLEKNCYEILFCVLVVIASDVSAQDVDVYDTAPVFNRHFTDAGGPEIKKIADRFRKETLPYYGVMFANLEEGQAGYSTKRHRYSVAYRLAKKSCEVKVQNKSGCKIYMSVLPKGFKSKANTVTLNQEASESYLSSFLGFVQNDEAKHFAFAVSNSGAWSWRTRGYETSFTDTKRITMDACNESSQRWRLDDSTHWSTRVMTANDYKCQMIISYTR